jgi:hypothetical protein
MKCCNSVLNAETQAFVRLKPFGQPLFCAKLKMGHIFSVFKEKTAIFLNQKSFL